MQVAAREVSSALSDLLEELLTGRPAWHADAACKERTDVDFFPGRGQPTEPAKAVCRSCLVREECHAYALDHDDGGRLQGVWAGLSHRERRKARTTPHAA